MTTRGRLSTRRPPLACEPDIPEVYMAAVRDALRWAWQEVCAASPDLVQLGTEEDITEAIERALNTLENGERRAPGLRLFDAVGRGQKTKSADGRIGKQPDLTLRPPPMATVGCLSDWGVFVECKLVDRHKRSRDQYCKHGVARFCAGEYAARMRSGMMLAYIRPGGPRSPGPALEPLLRSGYSTVAQEAVTAGDIHRSIHDRTTLPVPCVAIELTHLWLAA